jgi:DNA polymerase-3 subunit delta
MAYKQETDMLQELKADLRDKRLRRLYIFHGEETFLLHHYLGQIKKLLIDELTESFNYHRLNGETFDIQSFADAVENLPMMAENTMVQLDDIDLFRRDESERNKLAEILSDIPEYCTVILTYETEEWNPDKRYKKLYDAVNNYGTVVEFAKQSHRDLVAWITRHFAARGKRISTDLCTYLIDITDGTMTSLSGEIAKISSFSGADSICKADIDAVTEPVLDAVAYQMTDYMSRGQYTQALGKLHQLMKLQEEPVVLLGTIGSHFRRVSTARALLDAGKSASELMKVCGIREYPAKKAMEAARRTRPELCAAAARLVLETDRKLKTSFDDPQRLLELLVLTLAQEAKNA